MAYNNGVDQKYQLIEKALFEEGGDEAGASGGTNVLSWQLLQLSDCLGKISLDQCRVLPCFDTLQRAREDVLGCGVNECAGYLGYPFKKMKIKFGSNLSFSLLFPCQAGGEKVAYMAVYLSRFGTDTPNGQ
jgi:hypothetical protein